MITEVTMKRELFGTEIKQKPQSGFFSASDLVKAGNKWRILNNKEVFNINEYFRLKSTIEFMVELKSKYGEVKITRKGRSKDTWVHPLLFIDIALSISPTLRVEVYEWLFDNLIKFRNVSGDSYKKMAGCLYAHTSNKKYFYIEVQKIADKIKEACNVNNWEEATELQLNKRDKLHEAIALLSDVMKSNEQAVRIAINKYS